MHRFDGVFHKFSTSYLQIRGKGGMTMGGFGGGHFFRYEKLRGIRVCCCPGY